MRLALAKTGMQEFATTALSLAEEVNCQLCYLSNPSFSRDIAAQYDSIMEDLSEQAQQAQVLLVQAQRAGNLSVEASSKLEELNENAGKSLAKLQKLKAELIRRRLEGEDEFDGYGRISPALLVSVHG